MIFHGFARLSEASDTGHDDCIGQIKTNRFPNSSARRSLMQHEDLRDLYIEQLKDLYSAENQLIKALPRMAKAASNEGLKNAFNTHLEETRVHAQRIEQIMEDMGEKAKGKKCKAMEGLVEEGKEALDEFEDEEVLDAALIAAAQRVEHYEIAGYGCVRTYAQLLGDDKAARLLQQTLDEEGKTDKLLTGLAESSINLEAAQSDVA
jgi:ferritin-like metal-binding protein YciE